MNSLVQNQSNDAASIVKKLFLMVQPNTIGGFRDRLGIPQQPLLHKGTGNINHSDRKMLNNRRHTENINL